MAAEIANTRRELPQQCAAMSCHSASGATRLGGWRLAGPVGLKHEPRRAGRAHTRIRQHEDEAGRSVVPAGPVHHSQARNRHGRLEIPQQGLARLDAVFEVQTLVKQSLAQGDAIPREQRHRHRPFAELAVNALPAQEPPIAVPGAVLRDRRDLERPSPSRERSP